ncbi:hypothetical protein OSB04_024413 [Centaurea solstitialis]|uniref:Uncharacterized protein n=1 Tax=Centaurea solstitialis TaxID=347529 RepID=A0AA38SXS6_9ASTR|nr:hypothetical protein OSB04_024413 [Centaurea solstitialis]
MGVITVLQKLTLTELEMIRTSVELHRGSGRLVRIWLEPLTGVTEFEVYRRDESQKAQDLSSYDQQNLCDIRQKVLQVNLTRTFVKPDRGSELFNPCEDQLLQKRIFSPCVYHVITSSRPSFDVQDWTTCQYLRGLESIPESLNSFTIIHIFLLRVPATATTTELKNQTNWDDQDKKLVSLAPKCKRLLIMALPNDIFIELLRQLEGGITTLKNNQSMCINEYHEFKAKEGESLKDTYSRLNILISQCKRSGVIRTNEENNMLFLKSLGTEWLHLTMSMRTNLDLEIMSLADFYGSLASLEPQALQLKCSIGGPLALMAEGGKGKGEKKVIEAKKKKKKKKKKALVIEKSVEDEISSEEEMSMKDRMRTQVSFTKDYRRGSATRGRAREYERREDSYRRESSRGFESERMRDYDRGGYERKDYERKYWSEKEKGKEESRGE